MAFAVPLKQNSDSDALKILILDLLIKLNIDFGKKIIIIIF